MLESYDSYRAPRSKKLLGARASLLGARTLLGAPGLTSTRSKKLLGARASLLGASLLQEHVPLGATLRYDWSRTRLAGSPGPSHRNTETSPEPDWSTAEVGWDQLDPHQLEGE